MKLLYLNHFFLIIFFLFLGLLFVPGRDDFVPLDRSQPIETVGIQTQRALLLGGQIDVNSAREGEFRALPGIGPKLAARIVADRLRHGPFGSLSGLARVSGVGPKKIEDLRSHVVVSRRQPH